jgi:hypothetical protein
MPLYTHRLLQVYVARYSSDGDELEHAWGEAFFHADHHGESVFEVPNSMLYP